MLILALAVAAALQTAPPVGQFPWQPPGAEASELMLAGGGLAQMEEVSDRQRLVCPNDSRERQIEQERVKLPESVFGRGSRYSGEMLHCRLEDSGLQGPLLLHLTRRSPDGRARRNWMISLSSQAVQMGFAGVLEDLFDPATVSESGVKQPPVAKAEAPGFIIAQYWDQGFDNGGAAGEFVQRLFDLRGDEPREIAVHTWTNYGDRRCRFFDPKDIEKPPRCKWDPTRADFVCVQDDGKAKRTFLLIGQKPIPQNLGPSVPMETAKPGDRVRDLYRGIARFIASLSSDEKLIFHDGHAFSVRKVAGGWANYPSQLTVNDFQTHDPSPMRVVRFAGTRGERFFDIVQDQVQTLVRIGPSTQWPGDSVSQVVVGAHVEQSADVCASEFENQVLTVRSAVGRTELLYQDSFRGGSYAEAEEGSPPDLRCPRRVLITDDFNPSFSSGSRIACERPMGPLVPMPRLGRLDLLWGNGIVNMVDWVTEYSLRGEGRGTLLLLDSGLPQAIWEQLAVALPNNVEVLRVRVDLARDLSMGFSKTEEIAMQAKAALGAVSAKQVAVLAVGLTDEVLVEALRPLSPAPAAITAINPVPTERAASLSASGFRVLVTNSADISRWTKRGFKAAKINGLDAASLEKVILDMTRELGWSEGRQPALRK
jgi:hypothetical protein